MAPKRKRSHVSTLQTQPPAAKGDPKLQTASQALQDKPEQPDTANEANEDQQHHPINDPSIYRYRKRLPMRNPSAKRDIFVSRSSTFGALKARAVSLLDTSSQPIYLHAMGAAITMCCNLAVTIQAESGGNVVLAVRTNTVQVFDDYEPLVEGYPEITRSRAKSAIKIKISRTAGYV